MFIRFFLTLKLIGVPVSLREYLSLLEGMGADLVTYDVEAFYFLARAALVKDERHLDKFDRVFSRDLQGRRGGRRDAGGRRGTADLPRNGCKNWLKST